MSELEATIIPHLKTQFERCRAVLFIGAGFSATSKNIEGERIPLGQELAKKIWPLCFPSDEFEVSASLSDLYETALSKDPNGLKQLLLKCLTIQSDSIENWMIDYFSFPWHRIYTLNVDNLIDVIPQRSSLPRTLRGISATNLSAPLTQTEGNFGSLEFIGLNGTMADIPQNVTFSTSQYSRRIVFPDQFYQQLTADIVSRPIIFVGSNLNEPSLWQNIEIRKAKGARGAFEMRPRSYLVTPHLDRSRRARLSDFNISWIPMTAKEFSEQVLAKLSDAKKIGLTSLKSKKTESSTHWELPDVGDLATTPLCSSEFLLGQEPIWADIQSGRAVERASDNQFWGKFLSAFSEKPRGVFIVSGTAGSGKSTTLMRLALRITESGQRVAWIDKRSRISHKQIISSIEKESPPNVLAMDDADFLGLGLSSLLQKLSTLPSNPLIIIALRSGVIDRYINPATLSGIPIHELSVPHLSDSDITSILDVLEKENRLGVLRGKRRDKQEEIFKGFSGRQLLVAMISATSGVKFEEKIPNEFFELPSDSQRVYAIIALATTFRHSLSRQDILIALNDSSNESLNALNLLLRRHIVTEIPQGSEKIQARHRVIAMLIRDALQIHGKLGDSVRGLAFMAATHATPGTRKNNRFLKLLIHVINHDFLFRNLGLELSQSIYQELEELLSWDHHYWLQRGSLEVESGDLRLAENFLGQARGLSPNNLLIETEWAYLLFRKALVNPRGAMAQDFVRDATDLAMSVTERAKSNPHPFHVLGSQGLAWSRSGISGRDPKEKYLNSLVAQVEIGTKRFPKNSDLKQLIIDLKKEYYSLALH